MCSSRALVAGSKLMMKLSVGPPHKMIAGMTCSVDGMYGLMAPSVESAGLFTPPDRTIADDRYFPRPPMSCDVQSAPSLTPALETQFLFTGNCSETHVSMSSKKTNSSSRIASELRASHPR